MTIQDSIINCIVHYVKNTKSAPAANREELRVGGKRVAYVQKWDDQGAKILPGDAGVDVGGWTDDILREVASILRPRLAAKAKLPPKMGSPTILVLQDRYPFGSAQNFSDCIRNVPESKLFHTIYVVAHDDEPGYPVVTAFPTSP